MKTLTLKQIADWCGAKLAPAQETVRVTGVCTDSRAVKSGDLFVCIVGENSDGHQYLADATSKGAVAAVVSKDCAAEIPCLKVQDTVTAYGAIAAGYRRLTGVKVIGITGSVGKTTT